MTPSRPRRLLVAAVAGLAVPLGEVALKCRGEPRPGQATAEACTWARAWLPLTGPGYFVLVGGAVYGLLGLATRRRDELLAAGRDCTKSPAKSAHSAGAFRRGTRVAQGRLSGTMPMLGPTAWAEAPVYGWDTLVLLRHLLEQGLSKTAIAARAGISRRVLYDWLASGLLDRELSDPPPRQYAPRRTKLDPFRAIIDARLAVYPELSAVRLFEECRAAGYAGSLTQLKAYVRQVRPRAAPEPVVRFETPPGQQAQVDFAEVRFPWGRRFALMAVLGYSRLLWIQFVPRQTMQALMEGLEACFAAWGGVPKELLFDQLKAVVIADERPGGGKLLENPEFLRFAAHWGFRVRACRPYRAKTKGKVERPIRYLRENFLYGREFLGDGDLAAQLDDWLAHTANVRVHGTTKRVPRAVFLAEEQPTLAPLAARPYRPLVLPVTPARSPRVLPSRAVPLPPLPQVDVERRPLSAYHALLHDACDVHEEVA